MSEPKTVNIGDIVLPIANIDYIKWQGEYGVGQIYMKSGRVIECTSEEYKLVEAAL